MDQVDSVAWSAVHRHLRVNDRTDVTIGVERGAHAVLEVVNVLSTTTNAGATPTSALIVVGSDDTRRSA